MTYYMQHASNSIYFVVLCTDRHFMILGKLVFTMSLFLVTHIAITVNVLGNTFARQLCITDNNVTSKNIIISFNDKVYIYC